MRHIETKNNGQNIIMEEFTNYTEFLRTIETRETLWTLGDEPRNKVCDPHDTKVESFEEAVNMLKFGYSENLDRMKSRVGELQKHGVRKKTRRFADVVGYTPIVANALLGIPNSMVNMERKPVASKVVTICYEPSVAFYTTPQEVFDFGCEFVNAAMNLEENGVRVRIDYLKTNMRDGRIYAFRLPIKNERQPINLKRLMFPLTHIAMQRCLAWDWLEKLPNSYEMYGYGHSLYASTQEEKQAIESLLKPNEYLIHYNGQNVNDVLKMIDAVA